MTRRLRRGRPGSQGVERIAGRELDKALKDLTGDWPPEDEVVHRARKRLKNARSALRLARATLGDDLYQRENQALRDVARPLSEVRDATVMVQSLEGLELNGAGDVERLREQLRANQRRVRRKVLADRRAAAPLVIALRESRRRVDRARPVRHGWAAIGPGLRRTYRAGRRGFAAAQKSPTADRLHEWRKQTKYWWNILRILEPIAPRALKKLADQAHRLSDHLGEDHDLVVLRRRSTEPRTALMPSTRAAVLERIDRRREALQKSAMALGAIVYQHRPRNVERRLHRRWRAWRSA